MRVEFIVEVPDAGKGSVLENGYKHYIFSALKPVLHCKIERMSGAQLELLNRVFQQLAEEKFAERLGEALEQRARSVQLAGCDRSAGDVGNVFGNGATCAKRLSLDSLRSFIAAMKLPNGEWAYIDMIKLRGYSLSPTHPEGKHKARVFAAAPGISR